MSNLPPEDPNQALIDAMNALHAEVKRNNDLANTTISVESRQAMRALANVISNEIGTGAKTRGNGTTVSRHYLRRRARNVATRLDREDPQHNYTVERAERGPFRWRCIRTNKHTTSTLERY